MALKSMKLTKADQTADKEKYAVCGPGSESKYPYGLEVRLDRRSLEKLDMDSLPEVGAEMHLVATVKVVMASSRDSTSGKDRDLTLQITDLELTDGGAVSAMKRALEDDA